MRMLLNIFFKKNTDRRIAMILRPEAEKVDREYTIAQATWWLEYVSVLSFLAVWIKVSNWFPPVVIIYAITSFYMSVIFFKHHKAGYGVRYDTVKRWRKIKEFMIKNSRAGEFPEYKRFHYSLHRTKPDSNLYVWSTDLHWLKKSLLQIEELFKDPDEGYLPSSLPQNQPRAEDVVWGQPTL